MIRVLILIIVYDETNVNRTYKLNTPVDSRLFIYICFLTNIFMLIYEGNIVEIYLIYVQT